MVTLRSYLIWQIISFVLPPNEYGCAYAWTTLGSEPAVNLQKMPILAKKNHLFRWSSFWSSRVCKQAKLSHLGLRKPARIWLCIRLYNAGKWDCDRLTEDADFGKKNHILRWSSFWPWPQCRIWETEIHTHTLKSRRTQNESMFVADFRPEA